MIAFVETNPGLKLAREKAAQTVSP